VVQKKHKKIKEKINIETLEQKIFHFYQVASLSDHFLCGETVLLSTVMFTSLVAIVPCDCECTRTVLRVALMSVRPSVCLSDTLSQIDRETHRQTKNNNLVASLTISVILTVIYEKVRVRNVCKPFHTG